LIDMNYGPFSHTSADYVDPGSEEAVPLREKRDANFQAMAKAREEQARATPLFAELMKTTKDQNYIPTSALIRSFEETPSYDELESGIGSIATYPEYLKWVQSEVDYRARGGAPTRGADYYWGFTPKYNDTESTLKGYQRFVEDRIRDMQLSDISDEAGQMVDAMLGKSQSYFDQPMEDNPIMAYRGGGMTGSKKK